MTSTDLPEVSWFKSSYSGSQGDCVEVAWLAGGRVGVRDSKNPAGPALVFDFNEWDAFNTALKAGRLRDQ